MNFPKLALREAMYVYNALAQWADNERNALSESDCVSAEQEAALRAVAAVVENCEKQLIALVPSCT